MFDWDRFKNGEIAVHCDTEEKAKDFLKECNSKGMIWGTGDSLLNENNWEYYKESTHYRLFGNDKRIYFGNVDWDESRNIKIIKWEIKEMKELTFKEVIANIKEGEVWETCDHDLLKTISYVKGCIYFEFTNNREKGVCIKKSKYKLKRKEYTFEEAFKALEEGKEIESVESLGKYKKIGDIYKTKNRLGEWIFAGNSLNFHEIKGKWYIND